MGLSILESYSRVLESLANTVMSRIEDVLYADSATQDPSLAMSQIKPVRVSSASSCPGDFSGAEEDPNNPEGTPNAMTLSDFMDWNLEGSDTDMKKDDSNGSLDSMNKEAEPKIMTKHGNIATKKKFSYLDKLEWGGLRSPKSRH